MYFFRTEVEKGKKIVNITIIVFIIMLVVDFIFNILTKGKSVLIKEIISKAFFGGIIFLYFKKNRLFSRIVISFIPYFLLFIPTMFFMTVIFYILNLLRVIYAFNGILFIAIPLLIYILIYFVLKITDILNCITEYGRYINPD